MPLIEVPLQSWHDIPVLKRSKKFAKRSDEALALSYLSKLIEARRQELSIELYDALEEGLGEEVKSVAYAPVDDINRTKILDIVNELVPDDEDFSVTGAVMTRKAAGKSSKFDKKKLMQMPIPCSNPKCKAENHVTVDIIEACTTTTERRAGVSIKLAGEENGDE